MRPITEEDRAFSRELRNRAIGHVARRLAIKLMLNATMIVIGGYLGFALYNRTFWPF